MSAWEREDNLEQLAGTHTRARHGRESILHTCKGDSCIWTVFLGLFVCRVSKGGASKETTKPKDIIFSPPGGWVVIYFAYFSFCTQFL